MKKVKAYFSPIGKIFRDYPLLFFAILSFAENLLIETLSRYSLIKAVAHLFTHPLAFLLNTLIIMSTLSFALLFRRRLFGTIVLSTPWIVCGIINAALLSFRVTPLGAVDLQIADASFVLMYLSPVQRILLYIGIAIFVIGLITLWILGPKISGKIHYGKNVAAITGILICMFLTLNIGHAMKAIGLDFSNLPGAYEDYGFVYCFSSSVLDTGIDKPEEYSENAINEILHILPETASASAKPDIILIQLESFVDPKLIRNISYSDDPAPIHTWLRENYSCGELSVPSFGGGTANTEFEVLTGINLANFGPGEYPYKSVLLEETCESMAYNLKELGYSTHAIHNHTGSFYDRDKVYPNLGFDSFQSVEYMYDYDTTWYGWCKDSILTEEIITALDYTDAEHGVDSQTPRFVWTVSVQGHGKYPSEKIEGTSPVITIESDAYSEEEMYALEYYVNQTWEMDMFLGSLISALESRGKPVILIAYGDHLPAVGLEEEDFTTGDTYRTEYVTWNNLDLQKENHNLRSYELSAEIMSWLGFNNGNLTKLHQLASDSDSDITENQYQEAMSYLAYDMLYGENIQFKNSKPYKKTSMRMGTLPVKINSITYTDGALYVQGTGFTGKSTVFINGNPQNTVMLSQHSLMVESALITDGDSITIGQSAGKQEVLGYSSPIVYDKNKHCLSN